MTGWCSTNSASITSSSTRRIISRTWRRRPRWSASPASRPAARERAFDVYMKARYLRRAARRPRRHLRHRHADFQHDGRDVHDAAIPRPRGAARAAASSISTPGRPPSAKSSTRWKSRRTAQACGRAAASPASPTCRNSSRCSGPSPTCRRPRCSNLPRPRLEGGKPIVVACPMSEEQHALQQELVERYERLRSQKVDPREDNALAITTDGRKLATDARMLSATAPDFPESKVNRAGRERRRHLEADRRDARHADDLLRHGRQSDRLGVLALRRHHREAGRRRHSARADRRHRRRRIRRQETGPLREGPATARCAC